MQTIHIPLVREATLWERVLINMESYLLGMTFAVSILFEDEIETYIPPILFEPSETTIKHPFSKGRNLTKKHLLLGDVTILERTESGHLSFAFNGSLMCDEFKYLTTWPQIYNVESTRV